VTAGRTSTEVAVWPSAPPPVSVAESCARPALTPGGGVTVKVAVRSERPTAPSALVPVTFQPVGTASVAFAARSRSGELACAVTLKGRPAVTPNASVVSENRLPSGRPPFAGSTAPSSIADGSAFPSVNGTRLWICRK
jgi:hypothetical protein